MANDAVAEWYKRVAATQRSHYLAALRLGRMHYVLGVPVIVLTTLIGTSVFAFLSTQPDPVCRSPRESPVLSPLSLLRCKHFLAFQIVQKSIGWPEPNTALSVGSSKSCYQRAQTYRTYQKFASGSMRWQSSTECTTLNS